MNITIIGTGYVGLVTAACLADFGHFVTGVDKDVRKIEMLQQGGIPIYEPGLDDVVERNVQAGRLRFSTDLVAEVGPAQAIFIAVGTPPQEDGSADLQHVEAVAREIAPHINSYKVIVNKSTVPVGTGQRVKELIAAGAPQGAEFDVVSNPEFLREGSAVDDFMRPDRVVVGTSSERAQAVMREVYRALYLIETPFVFTNVPTAELIKYASNAFLATKITFINEMANLCEAVGADVQTLAKGMGMDGRIGPKFLHAGPGYGGSCFPKDTQALARIGRDHGEPVRIVETVIDVNQKQKERMVKKIAAALGSLDGKTIAMLGLAFKPNTDDMRESPAITIIQGLLAQGARVRAFDPAAMEEAKRVLGDRIDYCQDEYAAIQNADALVIVTEWNQFRRLDLQRIKAALRQPVLVDLRNIYAPFEVESVGFKYYGIGRELSGAKH